MHEERPHLWQGTWLSDQELENRLANLSFDIESALNKHFEVEYLLAASQSLSEKLADASTELYCELDAMLESGFKMEAEERQKELAELSKFLRRSDLEEKLVCELGSLNTRHLQLSDFRSTNFESWVPLGFLVHIAPTNAYSAGTWSVLEGLLSGNVNFLKTGGSDQLFAQVFLSHLIAEDRSGTLASRIFACRISSSKQEMLRRILGLADGIVVWGDEGAIEGVRLLAPASARFIEWGPKISFAYFASELIDSVQSQSFERAIKGLASEICRMEQQACSSPQAVFVETEKKEEIRRFADLLAGQLNEISPLTAARSPSAHEQAEITQTLELCRLESLLGKSEIIEAEDGSWRILIDYSGTLKASPLYRTIWLKPLMRHDIVKCLRPFRFVLQTCGLAAGLESMAELTDLLFRAGVLRITCCGEMLESYSGEPHDGVYSLQRYSRRVSLQAGPELAGISSFADLKESVFAAPQVKLMGKEDFQAMKVDADYGQLFFKSGGSSGTPKLSVFNYDDYHRQMKAAAQGLLAAGLDPKRDRCMNLFFGGGLYGGFISFFSILETIKAVQYPMSGVTDTRMVAETILRESCNVLLGMPSYLMQLFRENEDLLSKNKIVEKIFFAGEHLSQAQRNYLQEKFGVKFIASGGYGSVDAGPIGYQCLHCRGTVHHLHQDLQIMEILDLENDKAADPGTAGRVVLSSLARSGQKIERYEIGDLARFVSGSCSCGRKSPRFELLGRYGDVFKVGSAFFNYARFELALSARFQYAASLQILLEHSESSGNELLTVLLCRSGALNGCSPEEVCKEILAEYEDLREIVVQEKLLDLAVRFVENQGFERASSGKLKHVVDRRVNQS